MAFNLYSIGISRPRIPSLPIPYIKQRTKRLILLLALTVAGILGGTFTLVAGSLTGQPTLRQSHNRCFVGAVYQGVIGGCHLNKFLALTTQYHLYNAYQKDDPTAISFADADFVYGQSNVARYINIDESTLLGKGRLYLWGPLYIAGGIAHQSGSSRTLIFAEQDRMVGATLYENIEITVTTYLEDQTSPIVAIGAHHFIYERIGLLGELNFGIANEKKVARIEVTTNHPLTEEDLAHFKEVIRRDAETERFGLGLYGATFGFGSPSAVP